MLIPSVNRLYMLVWLAVGIGFLAVMLHSFVPLGTVGHVIESAQTEIEYAASDSEYCTVRFVFGMYASHHDCIEFFDSLEGAVSATDSDPRIGGVYECVDAREKCRGVYP